MMLFSPLLGRSSMYSLRISGKGCAGSTGTSEVISGYFHQNTGNILPVNSTSISFWEGQDLSQGKGMLLYPCKTLPGKSCPEAQVHSLSNNQESEMLPRKGAREDAEGEVVPFIKLAKQTCDSTTEE